MLGKQAFAKSDGIGLLHRVQTMCFPNGFRCFNNESRHLTVVLIGMTCEPAVLGLLKCKSECIELFLSAQPDETALAVVNIGLVHVGITGANAAVQAVAGDDQIRVVLRGDGLVVLHIGLKHQDHAQLQATVLQDIQQLFAPYTAEAVTTRANIAPFEKDFNVVPVVKRLANQSGTCRVSNLQVRQSLIRQHNAPAKGVKRAVALHHCDDIGWVLPLHEQCKVKTGGATT